VVSSTLHPDPNRELPRPRLAPYRPILLRIGPTGHAVGSLLPQLHLLLGLGRSSDSPRRQLALATFCCLGRRPAIPAEKDNYAGYHQGRPNQESASRSTSYQVHRVLDLCHLGRNVVVHALQCALLGWDALYSKHPCD